MNFTRRLQYLWPIIVKSNRIYTRKLSFGQDIAKIESFGFGRYRVARSSVFRALLAKLQGLVGVKAVPTMDLNPPLYVRGMTVLDRASFDKTVAVPTLTVPAKNVGALSKLLKKALVKIPNVRPIVQLQEDDPKYSDYKLVLIDPTTHASMDRFTEEQIAMLKDNDVSLEMGKVELEMGYKNWNAGDIIRAVLPDECGGFSGYSIIGRIVHLNLKDALLPYKTLIGEVLLDKVVGAETVVNKTNIIDNTYRNFQMEVIAGEENFLTFSRENNCKFDMDFSKVYWNSRLSTEHERIIKSLEAGDVLFDVFAGIGPFSVPAAKRKCRVYANDLNPESYKWLTHNFTANKVKPEFYKTFNKDGRAFIEEDLKSHLLEIWKENFTQRIHITMNLPALATEFLDAFVGLFKDTDPSSLTNISLPRIYCYTFSKCDNPEEDAKVIVEQKLGLTFTDTDWVRRVRNVAPNKEMLCASCELPLNVLFADKVTTDEPPEKRTKSE